MTREPKRMTRNERRRAVRRDVFLLVLALVILPVCTAYLVEWIMPAVGF